MEHEEIQEKLSELHDGELSPSDRDRVARHLTTCRSCQASLQEWQLLARAFFPRPGRPAAQQTDAFVRRVMARLPAPAGSPALSIWETFATARWLAPALGLASAALWLSFAPPYGAKEKSAPLFVADGREVFLTPPDGVRPAELGEALDPAAEER